MVISTKNILSILLLVSYERTAAFAPPSLARHVTVDPLCKPLLVSVDVGEIEEGSDIDSPPAEDYIVNVGELEGEDDEDGVEDDGEPPEWYQSAQRLDALRKEHRRHDNDTGSPEFQVAGMTERISYLTKHLKVHPKDFSTRRGLVALVNKRRRLLNYLYRVDSERYTSVIKSLGIRHKIPGNVEDKAEKYSRYPGQKAVKKHLLKK